MFGVDLFVTADKKFLNRKDWEQASKNVNRAAHWDRFPSVIVLRETTPSIPPPIEKFLATKPAGHAKAAFEVAWDEHVAQAMVVPFADVTGREVGDLVVLRDVTIGARRVQQFTWHVIMGSVIVGAGLFLFFFVYLGHVERNLAERSARLVETTRQLEAESAQRIAAQRENAAK